MPTGGLNISALARRTGVAPDTLRKWEQRYGILRPARTRGGQRRYGEVDVARVEWLQARLAEGYRIGEAAALLGGGDLDVARTPAELREALLAAVDRVDGEAVRRLLDHAFAATRPDRAFAEIVGPVLYEVGERWAAGSFSVAQEHLCSAAVRARLERLLADPRGAARGVAVLACAPGERHELGLLMLAVLLRADGWQVAYLGADTPFEQATELALRVDARLLCLSATLSEHVDELRPRSRSNGVGRDVPLVVGGAALTPDRAQALGGAYPEGRLDAVVAALRGYSG